MYKHLAELQLGIEDEQNGEYIIVSVHKDYIYEMHYADEEMYPWEMRYSVMMRTLSATLVS